MNDFGIDGRLGARIRTLRLDRNLSLDGLARRAEVSRAMLSRIERGESSPTAQLLGRICGGLGIALSRLFAEAETAASPLSRRSEQPLWRDPESGYLRRAVSPSGTGSPVDITEIEFPAGNAVAFDNQRLPGGDQHVWVLDGTLEVDLGGEPVRLDAGDCLLMRFDRPVVFRNPTTHPVRYAVVIHHGESRP
ncbi:MAG: helix-turn-helix domain-containing protein [Methylobacterium frigidaeris]